MSPTSSTTQIEPKNALSYKIRTMAGDIDALKKGSAPLHSEIKIDPAAIPQINKFKPSFPKIEPVKQEIKQSPPQTEPKKLEITKEDVKPVPPPQAIKIEAPPIVTKREEIRKEDINIEN